MLSWRSEGVRVGCWLRDTRGDSTAKECRTSRDRAQTMRFPDKSSRPTFKGRRKVSRGVGAPRGRLGGLERLLPFKRVAPAPPPLPGAGRGLGKFVFVAGKAPGGRRGRADATALPFCFREAVRAAAPWDRRGRLRGPAAGGGRERRRRRAATSQVRTSAPALGSLGRRGERSRRAARRSSRLWSSRSWRRRRRSGGGEGGGGGESLPPAEHGAPGAEAAAAGAPVAG